MPECYPPYQARHRCYWRWVREGRFEQILDALAQDLKKRGTLDLSECFLDSTFIAAKGGGGCVGPTNRGKGTKLMAETGGFGPPLAAVSVSAPAKLLSLIGGA